MATKEDTLLFNPILIEKGIELLDKSHPIVDVSTHNCILRPLAIGDFNKSFGDLLSQLNPIGNLDSDKFKRRFEELLDSNGSYYVLVIEDKSSARLVGAGVLILERKFYRSGSSRGRIEMLIVDGKHRGRGFGVLLVRVLTSIGQHLGCYAVSLETLQDNLNFYRDKCFYQKELDIYMERDYPDVVLHSKLK